jgi:hypothetical protein
MFLRYIASGSYYSYIPIQSLFKSRHFPEYCASAQLKMHITLKQESCFTAMPVFGVSKLHTECDFNYTLSNLAIS